MTKQLKSDILAYAQTNPQAVASVLNASVTAAQAVIHDWTPEHAWADGRAPPLLAVYHGAVLAIVNETDQCIEVFAGKETMRETDPI